MLRSSAKPDFQDIISDSWIGIDKFISFLPEHELPEFKLNPGQKNKLGLYKSSCEIYLINHHFTYEEQVPPFSTKLLERLLLLFPVKYKDFNEENYKEKFRTQPYFVNFLRNLAENFLFDKDITKDLAVFLGERNKSGSAMLEEPFKTAVNLETFKEDYSKHIWKSLRDLPDDREGDLYFKELLHVANTLPEVEGELTEIPVGKFADRVLRKVVKTALVKETNILFNKLKVLDEAQGTESIKNYFERLSIEEVYPGLGLGVYFQKELRNFLIIDLESTLKPKLVLPKKDIKNTLDQIVEEISPAFAK